MNIQQLRFITEVAQRNLRVSKAAEHLHVSQPSVSTQIKLLEEELGLKLFTRNRNRLTGITPIGEEIIRRARRALLELDEIRQVARAHAGEDRGSLSLATSHTQARFRLPQVLRRFVTEHPNITITIRPENGHQILDAVRDGNADIGIAHTVHNLSNELCAIPIYRYRRVLLTPHDHPLLKIDKPSVDEIAKHALVMYDAARDDSETSRLLDELAAKAASLLKGTNADVVKAYVEQGLGVTVLPDLTYDPARDTGLSVLNLDHLFPVSETYVVLNRQHYLREYAYAFLAILAPHLSRQTIANYLSGKR